MNALGLSTHDSILAAAYRAKALEALELGRQARTEGRQTAHAGYMSECLHWRALADAVGHRAEENGLEVTHR